MTPKLLASSSASTVGPIAPPLATTSGADANSGGAILPSPDFYRATSLLSIWGPCRRIGDEYLSCVVTGGMGMCKPLRRSFERCATETTGYSMAMLDQIATQTQTCQQFASLPGIDNRTAALRNCAADFMLKQQNYGPQ